MHIFSWCSIFFSFSSSQRREDKGREEKSSVNLAACQSGAIIMCVSEVGSV